MCLQHPAEGEPLFKSLRRRTILEQELKENRLSDGQMRELIRTLKAAGDSVTRSSASLCEVPLGRSTMW